MAANGAQQQPAANGTLGKERLQKSLCILWDGGIVASATLAVSACAAPGPLALRQLPWFSISAPALGVIAIALFLARLSLMRWAGPGSPLRAVNVPAAIVAGSALLAVPSLLQLFLPGIPINLDLPVHYQRLWGYTQSPDWSLATYWNPHLNGGYAPFQAYPILALLLIAAMVPAVGLPLAFKVGLVLIHFLLPTAALRFFCHRHRPVAGSLAFAFLLLHPGGYQFGGYGQLFIFGMLASVMASAMLLWAVDRTLRYWNRPSRRAWAAMSLAYGLTLMAHVMEFSLLLLFLPAMWIAASRQFRHLAATALALGMGAAFASFWFLPVARAHAIGLYGNTFAQGAGLSQFGLDLLWDTGLNRLLPLLAVCLPAAWSWTVKHRSRDALALSAALLATVVLWLLFLKAPAVYARLPWAKTMELERSMQDVRTLLLLLAALGGETIAGIAAAVRHPVRRPLQILLAGAFLAVNASHTGQTLELAQQQLNLPEDVLVSYQVLYELVPPVPGRILHQEVLGRVADARLYHSHLESLCPVISGREAIVFDGIFTREPLGGYGLEDMLGQMDWEPRRLREFFQRWNITAAVVSTAENRERLKWLPVAGQAGEWTILATGIEPGYFACSGGAIAAAEYGGGWAWADIDCPGDCLLTFKVHDSPNWTVRDSDGRPLKKISQPGARIEVRTAAGRHRIQFQYGLRAFDVVSHALTAAAALLLLHLAWPRQRSASSPGPAAVNG